MTKCNDCKNSFEVEELRWCFWCDSTVCENCIKEHLEKHEIIIVE